MPFAVSVLRGLLREVVPQGGLPDVVRAVRSAVGIGSAARTRPEGTPEPAILHSLTQTSFRSAVNVVPVSGGELLDRLVLVSAVEWGRWRKTRPAVHSCTARDWFDIAAGHVGKP